MEVLRKIRKELTLDRREPIRIVVSTGAQRPVRTLVIPRRLPAIVAVAAGALVLVALVLAVSSWTLTAALGRLNRQIRAMSETAENIARHPLPQLPTAAALGASGAGERLPRRAMGTPGRFIVESVNTGEKVEATLDINTGEADEPSYLALRHLMRCQRTGAEHPIDPRIIQLLFRISQQTGQRILLVSGFRSPAFSTAAFSYHARGMAVDIRVPGMTTLMLRELVRSLGVPGIGYYPTSAFVHADMREEPYTWTDDGSGEDDGKPSRP